MTNLRGEPAYVGRFCGSNTYAITPEVVAFYNDALDDSHPNYEKWAPPLLHHSEYLRESSRPAGLGNVRPHSRGQPRTVRLHDH